MNNDLDFAEQVFQSAETFFVENNFAAAEPLLNQLILKNTARPEIFHMLGTIYYDQGKFKKAIRAFQRALEIDPGFTDSSVGLSIILNDLGRYDEGQQVFESAKLLLAKQAQAPDSALNEKFASKHEELGDLYLRHQHYDEALEQFRRAFNLSQRKKDMRLHIVDCYFAMNEDSMAIRELNELLKESPRFVPALLRLGRAFYDQKQIPEAIEQWELVMETEPTNRTAKDYLRLVQAVQVTNMNEPQIEL